MKTIIQTAVPQVKKVVRVAVSNNFNCTEREFTQLTQYVLRYPNYFFFVNCNINTPKLYALNTHPYQAVITINPTLTVRSREVRKLQEISPNLVAFVRVKYIPGDQQILNLIKQLSDEGYTVVITAQRFNGKKTLLAYTDLKYYHFECSRYRLIKSEYEKLCAYADSLPNVYVCDRPGLGCSECGLCSILNVGERVKLASLNLSGSGLCKFNCPDCYAKTMQRFLSRIGQPPVAYDIIRRNAKQQGRTLHIKRAKAAKA